MSGSSATRFAKGKSGNPNGRPRKSEGTPSAFDVIIEKRLAVVQNGVSRALTVEEALQLRTYQDALGGSRIAQRSVLKMIAKREKWIADHEVAPAPAETVWGKSLTEGDPDNANAALLLLGIARPDLSFADRPDDNYERLLLEPWAVEAALHRTRGQVFREWDLSEMRRCTHDSGSIRWP